MLSYREVIDDRSEISRSYDRLFENVSYKVNIFL